MNGVSHAASRYDGCVEVCGKLDSPGLATDMPIWVDHTGLNTTVDQARIEDALEGLHLDARTSVLHVGVGNSKFAARFAPHVARIDGLTVSEPERAGAEALAIPNYQVHFLNKYAREFVTTVRHRYDYIVDNNLASFACCKFHFHRMLDNYLWCLADGGCILTDQRGMDWTVEDDPRWQLSYDDLVALEQRFPVTTTRLTDTVYKICRRKSQQRRLDPLPRGSVPVSHACYDGALEVCKELENPGLGTDCEAWIGDIDGRAVGTTRDQRRIEDALRGMELGARRRILHVGVGDSGFAARFAPQVGAVDGLTVSDVEKRFADELAIPNYTVHLVSKYSCELPLAIEHSYDYIIDNNLASFACCKYHFHLMLDSYLSCLSRGGRILTDQAGMDFSVGDDHRWRLEFKDLVALGDRFPLRAAKVTETVYELRHAIVTGPPDAR